MTKREIIYTVFEKLHVYSDDSKLSEELVASLIDTKRSLLIKQQYAKTHWHMPNEIKQEITLGVSLVEKINGYAPAGKILATSILPNSIKIKGKEGPLLVRKLDNTEIPITIVAVERIPYLFENRYTQHLTYCTVDQDGKMYLISKDNKLRFLKNIKITDIFEEPDKISESSSWDSYYPIELSMVDTLVQMIVKDLAQSLAIPADNKNDADDQRG